jgi:hypothetical protein
MCGAVHHHHHGLTDVTNEATSAGTVEDPSQVLGVISSLKKSMLICKKDYHKATTFEFLAARDRTMLQQEYIYGEISYRPFASFKIQLKVKTFLEQCFAF